MKKTGYSRKKLMTNPPPVMGENDHVIFREAGPVMRL
jgi:hypothetical protein